MASELWIGTYAEAGGAGLQRLVLEDGRLELREAEERIASASYAAWDNGRGVLWTVEEVEEGRILGWRRRDGGWEPLGACSSGGAAPCFVAPSPDGQRLAVANYGSGSAALVALDPASGAPLECAALWQDHGRGSDSERQDGPHVHCTLFDPAGEAVWFTDLGLDRVFRWPLMAGGYPYVAEEAWRAPDGWGPRHLLFTPDGSHAVLVCELAAKLVLLRREGAELVQVQAIDCTDTPATGNLGGHLLLRGEEVFVTNRGVDTLARFRLAEGQLEWTGEWPTGGASPRHVAMLPTCAIVANEKSGTVTLLDLTRKGDEAVQQILEVPGAAFVLAP